MSDPAVACLSAQRNGVWRATRVGGAVGYSWRESSPVAPDGTDHECSACAYVSITA